MTSPVSSGGSSSVLTARPTRPGLTAPYSSSGSEATGAGSARRVRRRRNLTPVMTRLGARWPAHRGHLDHCGHREQPRRGLRWAVGRIRERPAYAQLQERVHEIDQLEAQF